MTNQVTFKDSTRIFWMCIVAGAMLMLLLVFSLLLHGDITVHLLFVGILGLMILALVVSYNLTIFHRITCDNRGCSIRNGRNWSSSPDMSSFLWNEITGVKIFREYKTARRQRVYFYEYHLKVGERLIPVSNYEKGIQGLMRIVNERTPQLPYVWVRKQEIGNHPVLENVHDKYFKVSRY